MFKHRNQEKENNQCFVSTLCQTNTKFHQKPHIVVLILDYFIYQNGELASFSNLSRVTQAQIHLEKICLVPKTYFPMILQKVALWVSVWTLCKYFSFCTSPWDSKASHPQIMLTQPFPFQTSWYQQNRIIFCNLCILFHVLFRVLVYFQLL